MVWTDPEPVEVPRELSEAIGGHPLVATALVRRGIATPDAARAFLDPACYTPAPPSDLPDLLRAADRLETAIRRGERIAVSGDFDVDGQTATALLVSTLRDLGADPLYYIPQRIPEGHGLNIPALERLLAEGVRLLITCDTGVTAHQACTYAQEHGVDVIVTDHHALPDELPSALAVVEPRRLPSGHPLEELPGVGCAFKLAEELYGRAGRRGEEEHYLDLVALGIVADVVPLKGDNRYLLQRGLAALRQTERIGLLALAEAAGLRLGGLTEEHIAYQVAPRLNALGRLGDAILGVELLTTADVSRARILAAQVEGLNDQRRLITRQMLAAAQEQLARDPTLLDYQALVLAHPTWHPGVVGPVASRLAELYGRPAVVIATPPGGPGHGSARSVPGCDIHSALKTQADLLLSFGGHPMAAGLRIDPEKVPLLRRGLSRSVAALWDRSASGPALPIEEYLPLSDLSLELVAELERLAPFGPGNPPIHLATRDLTLLSYAAVGRGEEHRRMIVQDDEGVTCTVLWWQGAGQPLPQGRFDLAYIARTSDYQGETQLQLEWVGTREREPAPAPPPPLTINIVDYRAITNQAEVLEGLRQRQEVQVWIEARGGGEPPGRGRDELEIGPSLAIWTAPPGPEVLAEVLERVSPSMVYLFGVDPGLDRPRPFLERLAGMVKRALHASGGEVSIPVLAIRLAQRAATVRLGVRWLAARGQVAVEGEAGQVMILIPGSGAPSPELAALEARLAEALTETAAYRRYFATAPAEEVLPR